MNRGLAWYTLALLLAAGCSDDGSAADSKVSDAGKDVAAADSKVTPDQGMATPDQGMATPDQGTTTDAAQGVTLSGQLQPLFTSRCATTGCHSGGAPKAGLNLQSGKAHANLVGVSAISCSTYPRVTAGDPQKSVLMDKVKGSGACFSGGRMPPTGGALTTAETTLLHDWIAAGALDN